MSDLDWKLFGADVGQNVESFKAEVTAEVVKLQASAKKTASDKTGLSKVITDPLPQVSKAAATTPSVRSQSIVEGGVE